METFFTLKSGFSIFKACFSRRHSQSLLQRHFQRFLLKAFLKFFRHEDIISKFYCKGILKAFFREDIFKLLW